MSEAKHIIDILTKLKESEGWEYLTNKILISQYEGQLHWDKSLEEAKEKDEN